ADGRLAQDLQPGVQQPDRHLRAARPRLGQRRQREPALGDPARRNGRRPGRGAGLAAKPAAGAPPGLPRAQARHRVGHPAQPGAGGALRSDVGGGGEPPERGGAQRARGRRARGAVTRFAEALPNEQHAAALAAVLEDLLSDLEGWRPNKAVDPERLLVTRILRRLGQRPPSGPDLTAEGLLEFDEELEHARLRRLTGVLSRQPRSVPVLTDVVEAAG